jgi:hypothetical protein
MLVQRPLCYRRTLHLSLALVLVLASLVTQALAGPRAVASGEIAQAFGSPAAISGLWIVYPDPDHPSAREVTLFTTDGFMLTSQSPSSMPAPGEAPPGVTQLFSSQGLGLWQQQADGTVRFNFLEITYDPNGDYFGTTSIHGSLFVSTDLESFSGTYTVTITQLDGTSMDVQGPTPVTGTRVGL